MHASPCRYLYTHNYSISPLTVSAIALFCKCCCVRPLRCLHPPALCLMLAVTLAAVIEH